MRLALLHKVSINFETCLHDLIKHCAFAEVCKGVVFRLLSGYYLEESELYNIIVSGYGCSENPLSTRDAINKFWSCVTMVSEKKFAGSSILHGSTNVAVSENLNSSNSI